MAALQNSFAPSMSLQVLDLEKATTSRTPAALCLMLNSATRKMVLIGLQRGRKLPGRRQSQPPP